MAVLLSVRAESDLLCLLQSHPPQPAGGHVGQGLQHHFQSLRPLLMDIHGHHTSEHGELSLAARQPIRITASHSPIDLTCFSVQDSGFHLFPGWMQTVSFNWVLRGVWPSPPSHTNQRNYCCNIMFLHRHKREVDWKQTTPVLVFVFQIWGLTMQFWLKKISGNLQLLLFSSGRQIFFVNGRVPP